MGEVLFHRKEVGSYQLKRHALGVVGSIIKLTGHAAVGTGIEPGMAELCGNGNNGNVEKGKAVKIASTAFYKVPHQLNGTRW